VSDLDGNAEVSLVTLVTFKSGASLATIARYTTCTNPVVDGAETFSSEPSIEVTMGEQGGGTEDIPVKLRMLIRPPLDTLTSQRSHSPVQVTIEEADPTDLTTRRKLWGGVVQLSTRNLNGQTGIVEIEIAGWRHYLNILSNAWLADTSCNNVFGDVICGKDLSTIRETATIASIDGNQVTLTGLTTTATAGYWRFGYLAYDGLQVMVREYTTGSTVTLLKTPPASWVGQTVTCTPGCDKRLDTCRNRWDREARFTGFGFKLPAYNPLLESP
jgi:hypothetical protein